MVELFQGGLSVDERGIVGFVNEVDFSKVKRVYTVENHSQGQVRAWHGHLKEEKFAMAVKGSALVGVAKLEGDDVKKFVLSEKQPAVLHIPGGYANGFKSLTPDTKLVFFSTATLKESEKDDFRYAPDHWDIW